MSDSRDYNKKNHEQQYYNEHYTKSSKRDDISYQTHLHLSSSRKQNVGIDVNLNAKDIVQWVEQEGSKAKRLEQENLQLVEKLLEKEARIVILNFNSEELRKKLNSSENEFIIKCAELQAGYNDAVAKLNDEQARFNDQLQRKESIISCLTTTVENLKTTKRMLEKEKGDFFNLQRNFKLQALNFQNERDALASENERLKSEMIKHTQGMNKVVEENKRLSERMEYQAHIMHEEYEKSLVMMRNSRQKTEKAHASLQAFMEAFGAFSDNVPQENNTIQGEKVTSSLTISRNDHNNSASPSLSDPEMQWKRFFVGDSNDSEDETRISKRKRWDQYASNAQSMLTLPPQIDDPGQGNTEITVQNILPEKEVVCNPISSASLSTPPIGNFNWNVPPRNTSISEFEPAAVTDLQPDFSNIKQEVQ